MSAYHEELQNIRKKWMPIIQRRWIPFKFTDLRKDLVGLANKNNLTVSQVVSDINSSNITNLPVFPDSLNPIMLVKWLFLVIWCFAIGRLSFRDVVNCISLLFRFMWIGLVHYALKRWTVHLYLKGNGISPSALNNMKTTVSYSSENQTKTQETNHGLVKRSVKKFSIVMLNWDRVEYLKTAIFSLRKNTCYPNYELIVVDNGSKDGSIKFLEECADNNLVDKVILCSKNLGICAGFNTGFAYADKNSSYLGKFDNDNNVLSPGWMQTFSELFSQDQHIGALALNQCNHPNVATLPWISLYGKQLMPWSRWVCGSSYVIPRHIFEQVGWFQEGLGRGHVYDDLDYRARLGIFGYEAYYTKDFIAYHRTDLDLRNYGEMRSTIAAKRKLTEKRTLQLIDEYDSGKRNPVVRFPQYESCVFPTDKNIIHID